MDGYLAGNIIGRLLTSYIIVLLVMWILASKFNFKHAFQKTHRWYGFAAIGVVFVVGLVVSTSNKGMLL